MNNTMFNLNHRSKDNLINNYEEYFDDDWRDDDTLNFDYNMITNNVYNYSYLNNKKYSFPEKKGFTFKKNKYK